MDVKYTWILWQEKNCQFRLQFHLAFLGRAVYTVGGEGMGYRMGMGEIVILARKQNSINGLIVLKISPPLYAHNLRGFKQRVKHEQNIHRKVFIKKIVGKQNNKNQCILTITKVLLFAESKG